MICCGLVYFARCGHGVISTSSSYLHLFGSCDLLSGRLRSEICSYLPAEIREVEAIGAMALRALYPTLPNYPCAWHALQVVLPSLRDFCYGEKDATGNVVL